MAANANIKTISRIAASAISAADTSRPFGREGGSGLTGSYDEVKAFRVDSLDDHALARFERAASRGLSLGIHETEHP
jgi:hypothetical protein